MAEQNSLIEKRRDNWQRNAFVYGPFFWVALASLAVWLAVDYVPTGFEATVIGLFWLIVVMELAFVPSFIWHVFFRDWTKPPGPPKAAYKNRRARIHLYVRMFSHLVLWIALTAAGRPILGALFFVSQLSIYGLRRYAIRRRAEFQQHDDSL